MTTGESVAAPESVQQRHHGIRGGVTIEQMFIVIAALVGLVTGMHAIADNTMFVHLRTGIDMVRTHHVPSSDPYSYTAPGHAWTLQSWLGELLYGVLARLGGVHLVIAVNALMLMVVAAGSVAMARTGHAISSFLTGLVVVVVGVEQWSTRPTTFGFFCFLLLVAVRNRSIWWSFAIGAFWVNLHGSWPLGLLWIAAVVVGRAFDDKRVDRKALRRLGAFVAGVVVFGVVNPVGPKLLVFPFQTLHSNGKVFASIIEWMSPNFHNVVGYAGLLLAALCIVIFVLARSKTSWEDALPVIGFLALSLNSQRNFPYLAIALAPFLAHAVRLPGGQAGELDRRWGIMEVGASVLLGLVAFASTLRMVAANPFILTSYPVSAIAYAQSTGYFVGDRHVLTPDFVGCYLVLREGSNARVFIDDRYDMYPSSVSADSMSIAHLDPSTPDLLNKYGFDGVIWQKKRSLATYLAASSGWRLEWSDDNWVFYTRTR